MKTSIVVCGTWQRETSARALASKLGCPTVVDYNHTPTLNHARAWEKAHARAVGDWCGVVEDDAVVSSLLVANLDQYLEQIDTDIVSAYLGTGVPRGKQGKILQALDQLDTGIIVSRVGVLSHVAVFMRTSLVPSIVERMRSSPGIACDTKLDVWAMNNSHLVSFPVPSWVDHEDSDTTVDHVVPLAGVERRAHRYEGGRWSPGAVVDL